MTPDHEQLLTEMTQYLTSLGCEVYSAAYADICDERQKKILASIYSVPSTYIRTRSDRVAFHATTKACFEFDAKTNLKQDDIFVELLPIISHYVINKWFGMKTVYGFRWPTLERDDIGFEIDDTFVNMVDAVFLFDRPCQCEVNAWVKTMIPHVFPNAETVNGFRGGGSGDPAIKVRGHKLDQFAHWREVLKRTCAP